MNRHSMRDTRAARNLAERQAASAERQSASAEQQVAVMQQHVALVNEQAASAKELGELVSQLLNLELRQATSTDEQLKVMGQHLTLAKEEAASAQKLANEQRIFERTGLLLAKIALAFGIVAAILAALSLGWAIWGITETRSEVKDVGVEVRKSQFVITSPSENESVGLGQKVYGKTQFFQMNHYIVVTVVRTRNAYVQSEPAFVSPDGSFSGEARFGDQSVGLDDEFSIQVLATKTTLSPGILVNVPPDAIPTESVTVRRVEPSGNQIVITTPTNGAEVGFDDEILGKTPFPELNHYIVVTPVRIGTAFVQDNAASVNRFNGTFSGTARFGGAEVGVGEQFIVRIVATRSILPAGPLTKEPDDAVASNSVTVRRKK